MKLILDLIKNECATSAIDVFHINFSQISKGDIRSIVSVIVDNQFLFQVSLTDSSKFRFNQDAWSKLFEIGISSEVLKLLFDNKLPKIVDATHNQAETTDGVILGDMMFQMLSSVVCDTTQSVSLDCQTQSQPYCDTITSPSCCDTSYNSCDF